MLGPSLRMRKKLEYPPPPPGGKSTDRQDENNRAPPTLVWWGPDNPQNDNYQFSPIKH